MTTETPKNGLHTVYYTNGQIKKEGNYKPGKEDGQIWKEKNYKDDECISGDC